MQESILHNIHGKHLKFSIHIRGQMDLRKGKQSLMHPQACRILFHDSDDAMPNRKKAKVFHLHSERNSMTLEIWTVQSPHYVHW